MKSQFSTQFDTNTCIDSLITNFPVLLLLAHSRLWVKHFTIIAIAIHWGSRVESLCGLWTQIAKPIRDQRGINIVSRQWFTGESQLCLFISRLQYMFGRCEIAGNLVLKQDRYCFIALDSTRGLKPSSGVTQQISCISSIYLMILDNSKFTTMKENNFMVGNHHNMRNWVKGSWP